MHEFLGRGKEGRRWGCSEENRVCKAPVLQDVADNRGAKDTGMMSTRGYTGDLILSRLGRCSLTRASDACRENVGQMSVYTEGCCKRIYFGKGNIWTWLCISPHRHTQMVSGSS